MTTQEQYREHLRMCEDADREEQRSLDLVAIVLGLLVVAVLVVVG